MARHRIFLSALLSFIAGVALASLVSIPLAISGGIFVFGTMLLFLSRVRWFLVCGFVCLAFAAGTLRMASSIAAGGRGERLAQLLATAEKNRVPVLLDGTIVSFPELHVGFQSFLLREKHGVLLALESQEKAPFRYGERLRLEGRLRLPSDFLKASGAEYEMREPKLTHVERAARFSFWSVLERVREKMTATLQAVLPEPLAGYADALLLGNHAGLSAELLKMFKRVGTMHLVALSGFNITMVAKFFESLLLMVGFNRRSSFWPAAGGILFFVLLTGASASVLRAGIMGVLVLVAFREGRRYHMTNALALAAALMILVEPRVLRWDIGFQLSFAATAGIIFLGRSLTERLKHLPNPWHLRDALVATVAAQVAVLPLVISHFGEVSVISPLVNVLVLPVLPAVMMLGFLALGAGLVLVPFAKLVVLPVYALLSYQLWAMEALARLPFAKVLFPSITFTPLLVSYGLLGVGFLLLRYSERKKRYAQVLRLSLATPA